MAMWHMAVIMASALWLVYSVPALSAAVQSEVPSMAGRVVDSSGGLLPDVVVTAMDESGSVAAEVRTTPRGTFAFVGLPEGMYRVDLDLLGFDIIRYNHVRIARGVTVRLAVTLRLSSSCECIEGPVRGVAVVPVRYGERRGQILNAAGRPLPHAKLVLARGTAVLGVAYADRDGRFQLRAPVDQTWQLTVQESGFDPVVRDVSGSTSALISIRLVESTVAGLPDTERLSRGCRCGSDLFMHPGR